MKPHRRSEGGGGEQGGFRETTVLLVGFGFVGFSIRYNGSVSLSADLDYVSHCGCETTDVSRARRRQTLKTFTQFAD